MKKVLIVILIVAVLLVGGIVAKNQYYKFDEADFSQIVLDHIQPDIEAYKEEYGWTDVDVQVDLSDIKILSERKNRHDVCEMEGEVTVLLNVKEVSDALAAEDYSYELYQQIKLLSFGLAQMDAQYYGGYENSVNEIVVDNEGNHYTAEFDYDYVVKLYKNDELVFEKQLEKPKNKVSVESKDGKFRCKKCGSWVSHVAANGSCKNCVDIYDNEWYIAIDGNVYVDRGY